MPLHNRDIRDTRGYATQGSAVDREILPHIYIHSWIFRIFEQGDPRRSPHSGDREARGYMYVLVHLRAPSINGARDSFCRQYDIPCMLTATAAEGAGKHERELDKEIQKSDIDDDDDMDGDF